MDCLCYDYGDPAKAYIDLQGLDLREVICTLHDGSRSFGFNEQYDLQRKLSVEEAGAYLNKAREGAEKERRAQSPWLRYQQLYSEVIHGRFLKMSLILPINRIYGFQRYDETVGGGPGYARSLLRRLRLKLVSNDAS